MSKYKDSKIIKFGSGMGITGGLLLLLAIFLPLAHMSLIILDVDYSLIKYEKNMSVVVAVLAVLIIFFALIRLGEMNIIMSIICLCVDIYLLRDLYNPVVDDITFNEAYKLLSQMSSMSVGYYCMIISLIFTFLSGLITKLGKSIVNKKTVSD